MDGWHDRESDPRNGFRIIVRVAHMRLGGTRHSLWCGLQVLRGKLAVARSCGFESRLVRNH